MKKILKDKNLTTDPQYFMIINNLPTGESLEVFENKSQETRDKTMTNYDLIIRVLKNHLLPPN